jgi:hypothetical protein
MLDVEIVVHPDELLAGTLAGEIAERAGAVFGSAPHQTWVKVRPLAPEQYAENGGGPPEGVYPVFVAVLKAQVPAPEHLQAEVAALTAAVAAACARPIEHVHVVYLPSAAGRVAFGGVLATS